MTCEATRFAFRTLAGRGRAVPVWLARPLVAVLPLALAGLLAGSAASASALSPECVPATFTVTCIYLSSGSFEVPTGVSGLGDRY